MKKIERNKKNEKKGEIRVKKARLQDWKMNVEDFEKNGCMLNCD